MTAKDAYIDNLKAKLDELNGELDILRARGILLEAKAEQEYREHIETIRARRDEARDKLKALSEAGDDAWEDLKSGFEKACDDLGDAVSAALAKFR